MTNFPQVKGQRFNRIAETVRELSPHDRFQVLLDKVAPATRDLLVHPPSATDWVALQPLDELLRKSLQICYLDDLSRVFEQGRLSFIRDVKTVYKVFIRFLSAEHVIHRASQIYGTYYKDNGTLAVLDEKPRDLLIGYENVPLGSPAFWEQSRGSLHGALEATGMRDISVEVTEGGGEAQNCKFRIFWR